MLKRFSFVLIYLLLLLPGIQNNSDAAATPPLPSDSSIRFIANEGQWPSSARFQATTRDGVLWLADDGLWFTRTTPGQGQINIHLTFLGLNAAARWEPFDPQETVVSYFHGHDPEQWQGGVPVWGGVLVHDLVPGADLRLTGQNGQVVTEWVVTGDTDQIAMQVEGADEILVRGRELRFLTPAGSLTWPLPTSLAPLELNITNETNELNIPLSTQHSALSSQPPRRRPARPVPHRVRPGPAVALLGHRTGGDAWAQPGGIYGGLPGGGLFFCRRPIHCYPARQAV